MIAEDNVSLAGDYFDAYIRDIAERKLTEEALAEVQRKFRLYVDKSPDGIFVVNSKGKYVDVNPAACSLIGYPRKDLLQMEISDIGSEENIKSFETLKKTGEFIKKETVLIRKDGTPINVEIKAVSLGNGLYMAYVNDITERKSAEIKIRESERLFSKVFHSNPNALAIITLSDGTYIDVNESFLRLHEYKRDEVIGRTSYELKIWRSSQRREQLLTVEEKVKNFEVDLYSKSGKKLTGLYSLEKIEWNGKECAIACFNDLTDKKKVEEEIARLDRLNLIGEMSASIGHEVRNPMTTVKGFLQLIGREETDNRKQQYYDLMIEELDRANAIITEFLSLAKDKIVKMQSNSLNTLIDTLHPLLLSDAIKQDKMLTLSKGDIPNILMDDKEMRQLIMNLARNGLESMSAGGTLTIGTYSANNEVVLFVKDEGSGIRSEILEKLGNPFFTTKDTGTGLGLAVSYSIADRHNATIDIQTGLTGTTFYVRFKFINPNRVEQVC